jgi:hypothetical protein
VTGFYELVAPGDYQNIDFGNHENIGEIHGLKFEDKDGDSERDVEPDNPEDNEPGLADWVINLKKDGLIVASTTTDEDGVYSFYHLAPGEYQVEEELQASWQLTYPSTPYNIIINNDLHEDIDFGNFKLGKVAGFKYEDLDGDGHWDTSEPKLADWLIKLNGPVTASVLTDISGVYSFENLPAGDYVLSEKLENNWYQSGPKSGSYQFKIKSGVKKEMNFGNYRLGSIAGRKYQDLNFNGVRNTGEPYLSSWQIELYNLRTGEIKKVYTDPEGSYYFGSLVPGPYLVKEKVKAGWLAVNPKSTLYRVDLPSNEDITGLNFGNNTIANYLNFRRGGRR